jgi:hypothetical protein
VTREFFLLLFSSAMTTSQLVDGLKSSLSVTPNRLSGVYSKNLITHAPVTNSASWKSVLGSIAISVSSYVFTKTLFFKPKAPKGQSVSLIVVVALESTQTSSSEVSKAAGVKEVRFSTGEFVKEILGVNVEDGGALPLVLGFFWTWLRN